MSQIFLPSALRRRPIRGSRHTKLLCRSLSGGSFLFENAPESAHFAGLNLELTFRSQAPWDQRLYVGSEPRPGDRVGRGEPPLPSPNNAPRTERSGMVILWGSAVCARPILTDCGSPPPLHGDTVTGGCPPALAPTPFPSFLLLFRPKKGGCGPSSEFASIQLELIVSKYQFKLGSN